MLLSLSCHAAPSEATEFDEFVKPLLRQKCIDCHGDSEANGELNLEQATSAEAWLHDPKLIQRVINAIDANEMPPEDEPQLTEAERVRLIKQLKQMLAAAALDRAQTHAPLRRLNRFQYNNTVRDLFQLKRDVFALPEKLMTRYDNYLQPQPAQMPASVNVASHSLNPKPGLAGVRAFPKDLRALHGYDNQANQLTLSPLLLDAFLRLSVSIVESADFNAQTVGIWKELFQDPAEGVDRIGEVRRRLKPFMRMAFRRPVETAALDRYVSYAGAKMQQGLTFTESMKKVVSAMLSSPLFLYRATGDTESAEFELASNLSYFLWASCPDQALLDAAASGELSRPDVLRKTIDRMMADPKIERFLDAFPSQWMQLENVLAATPDPRKNRYFSLDENHPASLQMVLEPLLLFDTVFVENRPLIDFISPTFAYQSDFLQTWYTTDLQPPAVDAGKLAAENQENARRREQLESTIEAMQAELVALESSVRERLLAAKQQDPAQRRPLDLKPLAAWEFNGDLKESLNSLDLEPHGKVEWKDGMVVLNKAYLRSKALPVELREKTLEVWCQPHNLDQRGGGVMGIQGPGDFFDTIVLGERKPRHWISGSNGFSRTLDFPESTPEDAEGEMLHLVMVYRADGTTMLYRNGQPYGKPYRKGSATFPQQRSSVIFGLRHLPPGGNKYLSVSIDKARLYDRALTAEEVAAAASGNDLYVTRQELLAALTPAQRMRRDELIKTLDQSRTALQQVPGKVDPAKLRDEVRKKFDNALLDKMRSRTFHRVPVADPRYGGIITNAAMLSMTSGPKRTHPVARGVWIIEVIFNNPPAPPPNDVPPLNEDAGDKQLTIREKFAAHRANPSCGGCHSKLDPLGFALENYDITGRWRDKYENGRDVDAGGRLLRKYDFDGVVRFKESLVKEERRFAQAFASHLLRFAVSRELTPADSLVVDGIIDATAGEGFKLKSVIREVILSDAFRQLSAK